MRKVKPLDMFKHMEIVLGLAFLLLAGAALLGTPPAPRQAQAAAFPADVPVVVITGKRMTAEEKRAALVLF